ncbi:MAG: HD domain-containing protein [Gammaproteobacteria bacterium]|nr:HD domain-containing protein [Gammaproteobacteria bacterium]
MIIFSQLFYTDNLTTMNNQEIFHVIKDPVHGTMQFTTTEDNWIKPFIDSPNFQRLRHVKQLGMGDYIFPGAVHTRFNHCIGCCYVASQIAHKIGLSEEERQLVIIACLLHDIGHGPFSHAFEDIFHRKLIRHEAWTPFFLAEYSTPEFFAAYNKRNPRHHMTEEKFLLIEEMIMHKSATKTVIADIVSSQLDSDRLDYLLRDSHFCGVTYGEFDFRWMLNCMVILDSKHGERLGITHKGVGVVEHYLMARRLMTRNIYHYQKKLALEYFLIKLLVNLADSLEDYAPFAEIKPTRLGKFLLNANTFNQKIKSAKNTEKHKQDFLEQNYANYKELSDYDVFTVVKQLAALNDSHAASQLAKRIQFRHLPKNIRLDNIDLKVAEQLLADFKRTQHDIQDWQINIIKTPHQSYTVDEDPILVLSEQQIVKPITEMSLMINAISDKSEHTAFLCIDSAILEDTRIEQITKKLTENVSTPLAS